MSNTAINPKPTLSVAVLSGKGGVGKTNLALNLGYALYKTGHKLLLMDFDIGLANIDVLMGLSPEKNLQDLFQPDTEASDVVYPIEENGFDFLPSASGVPELLEMDDDMREALFGKLNLTFNSYDYLFLDLGAGISQTVLSVASMSHMPILIVTPEPTSLTDSYAVIKVLNTQYGLTDFNVLVNQIDAANEGKLTFDRLNGACGRFLGIELNYLGGVHSDPSVPEAVRRQTPLMKFAPRCKAAQDILNAAVKIHRYRQNNEDRLKQEHVLRKIAAPQS